MENRTELTNSQNNHPIFGGRAYVFRRDRSPYWQAAAFLNGHNYRHSTKAEALQEAIKVAEDWYLRLHGQASIGVLPAPAEEAKAEPTFTDVAEQFIKEYAVLTEGQRAPRWVQGHQIRLRLYLLPFFGTLPISQVTSGKIQEYRVMRMTPQTEKNPNAKDNRNFKPKLPAPKTLHNEIVTLRLVLKSALRLGLIAGLPDLSAPFRKNGKVSHRAWFSPNEYKQLYTSTREYAKNARPQNKWTAEQLHDFVLFMANTGLRPDEAANLQHRDVEIVHDEDMDEEILVIEVRGKRGVGYCKSTANAVEPYRRLLKRPKPRTGELPKPNDPVFPGSHIKMFNALLGRINLKCDRDNQPRTSYSLRHTPNKDRSVFRKHIGRSLLARRKDPFLETWEIDLTTRKARELFAHKVDRSRLVEVEQEVSDYMNLNFSFAVLQVDGKDDRLAAESGILSAIAACAGCCPSKNWLGLHHPKPVIRESGLWNVLGLDEEPITPEDVEKLLKSPV